MLFADISATTEEENPQIAKTPEMEEVNLLMMSPMEQRFRTTSPSLLPMMLGLWDPFHASLMEIKPKQKHSLLSTSGTSC